MTMLLLKIFHYILQFSLLNNSSGHKMKMIPNILKWMKGSETFGDQGCLLLNIGYKEQETSSNIKLSSDTRLLASVIQNIKFSSRKCSIVVISGKYLYQVDEIMMTIDKNISPGHIPAPWPPPGLLPRPLATSWLLI